MAIKFTQTGIEFPDGSTQSSKLDETNDKGIYLGVQTFTSSGTWTKPSGCGRIRVVCVGSGGAGCQHGESGGAGGYAEKWIDVSALADGTAISVTVGAAQGGRNYYGGSNNGGTSSFGSYVSATGGYGANSNWGHTGGHGGNGSGGDINVAGGGGSGHTNDAGMGAGSSYWGGGSPTRWTTWNSACDSHAAPGSGGSSTRTTHNARGSNSLHGMVVVWSFK